MSFTTNSKQPTLSEPGNDKDKALDKEAAPSSPSSSPKPSAVVENSLFSLGDESFFCSPYHAGGLGR